MPKNLSQYNFITPGKLLLITFVVVTLAYLPFSKTIKDIVGAAAEPIAYWTNGVSSSINNSFGAVSDIFTLRDQNNALRIDNARLQAQNSLVALLAKERDALKTQLALGAANQKLVEVEVINSGVYGQSEYLIINKGSRDGLASGQKAVSGNIFVGLLDEVNEQTSRVVLPYARTMNLKVKIVNADYTGDTVDKITAEMAKATFGYSVTAGTSSGVRAENIAQGFDLKVGQTAVIDDEKVGQFLVLGKVSKVESQASDPNKAALVDAALNYYDLKYIFIVK
jgi:cell shape-determining protein MreC